MLDRNVITAVLASLLLVACQAEPTKKQATETVEATFSLQVPSPGWKRVTTEGYLVKDEVWLIHHLEPPTGMSAQVISQIEETFQFKTPSKPTFIKHYVVGKTWGWENDSSHTFVENTDSLQQALADAQPLVLISD